MDWRLEMFAYGLLTGLFIGVTGGVLIMRLCNAAGRADDMREKTDQPKYNGTTCKYDYVLPDYDYLEAESED